MLKLPIQMLEAEVRGYATAREGSAGWVCQQAISLGLSFLKRAEQAGVSTPQELDALRKQIRKEVIEFEVGQEAQASGEGGVLAIT